MEAEALMVFFIMEVEEVVADTPKHIIMYRFLKVLKVL